MVILVSMHIEIFVFFYITIYNECKCTYNVYIYNIFVRCIILIDVDIFHELDIPWYFGQLMLRFLAND